MTTHNPIGYIGSSQADISGWTCDQDDYAKSLKVEFYKDGPVGSGVKIGEIAAANTPREAAVAGFCGGKANHGYIAPASILSQIKDGSNHTLYVYATDNTGTTRQMLSGSPKTYLAPNTPTPKPGDITGLNGLPDNKVNGLDHNLLVDTFGQRGLNLISDFNNNGKVDIYDYNVIVTNYNK